MLVLTLVAVQGLLQKHISANIYTSFFLKDKTAFDFLEWNDAQ